MHEESSSICNCPRPCDWTIMQGPADLRTFQFISNCLNLDGGCFFLMACVEDKLTWRYIYQGVKCASVHDLYLISGWFAFGDFLRLLQVVHPELGHLYHKISIGWMISNAWLSIVLLFLYFFISITLFSCSFRLLCCGIETNHGFLITFVLAMWCCICSHRGGGSKEFSLYEEIGN